MKKRMSWKAIHKKAWTTIRGEWVTRNNRFKITQYEGNKYHRDGFTLYELGSMAGIPAWFAIGSFPTFQEAEDKAVEMTK